MRTKRQPVFVGVREMAETLGVCTHTVAALAKRGELPPATRLGSRHVFARLQVERWLAARGAI